MQRKLKAKKSYYEESHGVSSSRSLSLRILYILLGAVTMKRIIIDTIKESKGRGRHPSSNMALLFWRDIR